MTRLFRSFSWGALPALLGLAVVTRGCATVTIVSPGAAARFPQAPGALAAWSVLADAPLLSALADASLVVLVGFFAAASLQACRLANAGTLPAYLSLLLASAALAWMDLGAGALAALVTVGAAHQLYGAYRQQGDSLPVFNAGFLVGLAWLLSAPFVWMVGWAFVTLSQLRTPRGRDFVGLLLGVMTLPLLWGMAAYVFGDLSAALPRLTDGVARLPTLEGLRQNALPLAVLAGATLLALGAFGRLTTRRTVQEQRAHRLYYTMLPFAWAAVLLSGPPPEHPEVAFSPAPLLPALSVLLGVYLLELPRRPANVLLAAATLAVLGAHAYAILAT